MLSTTPKGWAAQASLGANTQSPNDPPALGSLMVAYDRIDSAIGNLSFEVSQLEQRLTPALTEPSETGDGILRPAYSAQIVESAHQYAERIAALASRIRELQDRLAI